MVGNLPRPPPHVRRPSFRKLHWANHSDGHNLALVGSLQCHGQVVATVQSFFAMLGSVLFRRANFRIQWRHRKESVQGPGALNACSWFGGAECNNSPFVLSKSGAGFVNCFCPLDGVALPLWTSNAFGAEVSV